MPISTGDFPFRNYLHKIFLYVCIAPPTGRKVSVICGVKSCISPLHLTYEQQSCISARTRCLSGAVNDCVCEPRCLKDLFPSSELLRLSKVAGKVRPVRTVRDATVTKRSNDNEKIIQRNLLKISNLSSTTAEIVNELFQSKSEVNDSTVDIAGEPSWTLPLPNESPSSSGTIALGKRRSSAVVDGCSEPEVKKSVDMSQDPAAIGSISTSVEVLSVENLTPDGHALDASSYDFFSMVNACEVVDQSDPSYKSILDNLLEASEEADFTSSMDSVQ